MSNFFDKAKNDATKLEEELLGPDYQYYKYINSPEQMGMSSDGSISALSHDIAGLIAYVQLLVSGTGEASGGAPNTPLGNKFFLKTGAQCKDVESGELVTRSIYVNNQPDGSIPFISSGMGVNFSSFKGLIPGTMSNLSQINPMQMFSAFMSGPTPDCQLINMETIDQNNVSTPGSGFVTTNEISGMNGCWFSGGTNPVTGITNKTCKVLFTTMKDAPVNDKNKSKNNSNIKSNYTTKNNAINAKTDYSIMPNNVFTKLYYSSLSLLLLYIFLKVFQRRK